MRGTEQAHPTATIGAAIAQVHDQFPDSSSPIGEPDGHHQQVRFQWGLGPRDAEPLIIGFDVLIVDDDGRIAEVRGFLDKVPS